MRYKMDDKIPIENIYYMLCYAWGYLKEKDIVNVNSISKKDLPSVNTEFAKTYQAADAINPRERARRI